MNMNNDNTPMRDDAAIAREEVLIGRVTDAEASPSDWAELEVIAVRDPAVWQRLAQAQRAHARLESAVEDRIALSELVDIPRGTMGSVRVFTVRWREYAGWAAAAVVALTWFGIGRNSASTSAPVHGGNEMQAGLFPVVSKPISFDDARAQYVKTGRESGRVLMELPSIYVDASKVPHADTKAFYVVRPFLERVEATDGQLWRVSADEHGRPMYVPAGGLDDLIKAEQGRLPD